MREENEMSVNPMIGKNANKLTNEIVKNAVCELVDGVAKDKRFADGGGLFLLATTKGGKLWRFNYSFNSKKEVFVIGKYPDLSLKEARKKALECRGLIANGINPNDKKREDKKSLKKSQQSTFEVVASEWLKFQEKILSANTIKRHIKALTKDFYPRFGTKEMNKIEKKDLIAMSQMIQERGALESGYRALNLYKQIEDFAFQHDLIDKTISNGIDKKSILIPHKVKNHRTITEPKRIGELMNAIDTYRGDYSTRYALKILPFVFVRSANIRMMEWSEIDFENAMWTIPAHKMKMKLEHKLPLHKRVIELLREIEPYTKDSKYVFPSPLNRNNPLSETTLNMTLKRLDFGDEIVTHGFRAMFTTITTESGEFRESVIESLMAHQEGNKIRRAYNRAKYEEEKITVINWYGDFLEDEKAKAKKGADNDEK